MGLQELLIAIQETEQWNEWSVCLDNEDGLAHVYHSENAYKAIFDLTKNLHNQSEEFYTKFLPLISHD